MKLLSLPAALLLGLSARQPAQAQQTPATLPVTVRLTHDDSVAVLHQLFRYERRWGRIGTIADAIVLPSNVVNLVGGNSTDFQRGIEVANVAIFGPLLVSSSIQWARYSKRREREAVLRFEQRQVQPLYVQRAYALALIERSNKR